MSLTDLIIIGVTGLPSSGKGLFGETAKQYGFTELIMGDVIRNECKIRGLPITRESSDLVMIKLREEKGPNAVALVTVGWIHQQITNNKNRILVDGIRSLAEVRTFQEHFPNFRIIGVHSNPKTRLSRAMSRKRIDDAFSKEAFTKRDVLELQIGVGDVIATADILISSEGSIEETRSTFEEVLRDIIQIQPTLEVHNNPK
ncbi:MAG: AAA family ATPase [Candidatus Kariarchaeaceae archaeon]|jgi:dephospho-CoA kinase